MQIYIQNEKNDSVKHVFIAMDHGLIERKDMLIGRSNEIHRRNSGKIVESV